MDEFRTTNPRRSRKATSHTTQARAAAQRAKLDAQRDVSSPEKETPATPARSNKRQAQPRTVAQRRAATTLEHAIGDYLLDHEGGNRSPKTIEWHRTALHFPIPFR